MKIHQIDCVVFDVETTGLNPVDGDRIVEIAAVKVRNREIIGTFESFVNPQRPIPKEAQAIHKITPAMVADAPTAAEVLPGIIHFIGGACLAGHNIKFDLDFLCYELALHGRRLHAGTPTIDTLKMTKLYLPYLSLHRLENIAQYFGERIGETHRALADVKLTVTIFNRLIDIAAKQGLEAPAEFFKQFGVEKPNFKIEDVHQATLF